MDDELENTTESSQENYKWISLQSMHRDAMCAITKAFEHPQPCFVCDLAQKFITSKFSYLLVSNPNHKTGAQ